MKLRHETWSLPGKIFLLGEYAVLAGLPAWVATVGPRFSLRSTPVGSGVGRSSSFSFHPESPVGKLFAWAQLRLGAEKVDSLTADWTFEDPWQGAGGFGASTAQFALFYRLFAEHAGGELNWSAAWKLYRELTRRHPDFLSPSGADLAAQWQGGLPLVDLARTEVQDLSTSWDLSALMIFSATGQVGRKVATHHHLDALRADLKSAWIASLQAPLESGVAAALEGDLVKLGAAMDRYADALSSLGLEVESTHADRECLRAMDGVLGVKGAGALQSDAVLVLMDPSLDRSQQARQAVQEQAQVLGLKLVCDGLHREEGLTG